MQHSLSPGRHNILREGCKFLTVTLYLCIYGLLDFLFIIIVFALSYNGTRYLNKFAFNYRFERKNNARYFRISFKQIILLTLKCSMN